MRTADFYITPVGKLDPEFFSGLDDLPAAIQAWAEEGATKYSEQEAQDHWVYHRGFEHIANRLYHSFSTADVEWKGQFRREEGQMAYFANLSEHHLERAEAIEEGSSESATRSGSKTVKLKVLW